MKVLAAVALLAMLTLAGCGGKTPTPVTFTCPDGKLITLTGGVTDGPAATSQCPVAPTVHLGAASYTVGVYHSIPITWTVLNGTHPGGHTMLTTVRLSHHPMAVSDLTGPDSYGIEELPGIRMEHQPLPKSFNLTTAAGTFTSSLVGIRYLRAYATILADDLPSQDYWSEEVTINITPVQPTGVTHTLKHGQGASQGGFSTLSPSAKLGDAITFENDDVIQHTFSEKQKPACALPENAVTLAAGVPTVTKGPTPGWVMTCPGSYTFDVDDQPAHLTLTVDVNV